MSTDTITQMSSHTAYEIGYATARFYTALVAGGYPEEPAQWQAEELANRLLTQAGVPERETVTTTDVTHTADAVVTIDGAALASQFIAEISSVLGGAVPPDAAAADAERIVSRAYARYDTDSRVHGPDDGDAFRDAVLFAMREYATSQQARQ